MGETIAFDLAIADHMRPLAAPQLKEIRYHFDSPHPSAPFSQISP